MKKNKIVDQKNIGIIFIKTKNLTFIPSSFAKFCLPLIKDNSVLLELGCGNGRDTLFFAKKNIFVYASDISIVAIENIKKHALDNDIQNIELINEDYTDLNISHFKKVVNIIYSRFSIHTIHSDKIRKICKWSYNALSDEGLFMIEARSTNDPLFTSGKGTLIDKNTFMYEEGHIRNFVEREQLISYLVQEGFKLLVNTESNNLSIYEGDNPVLLRVIAKKESSKYNIYLIYNKKEFICLET